MSRQGSAQDRALPAVHSISSLVREEMARPASKALEVYCLITRVNQVETLI